MNGYVLSALLSGLSNLVGDTNQLFQKGTFSDLINSIKKAAYERKQKKPLGSLSSRGYPSTLSR